MAYSINKYYQNILGLDLRVSDLNRSPNAATEADNVLFRQTGALSKRQGFHIRTDLATGGAGLVKFNNVEIGTGNITEELLIIDDNLHLYTQQTYTITYTGAGSAYYDFYLDKDAGVFKWDLYEDNNLIFSENCGTGKGASDTTLAQIKTLVDAETGFSMTITDAGSVPIAYSPITRVKILNATGVDNYYYTWTQVDTPNGYATPFSAHWAIRNNSDFEIASTAQAIDVLYISNGYDDLHKYDGNRVYKAGLPQPAAPTAGSVAAGALTGDYKWKVTYEHTDAKQNILVSQASETLDVTLSSQQQDVTISVLDEDSGYGVAQAIINGNQSGVNIITVDAGHGLKVGDQVYVDDGVSGAVVKREVTATSATTITIDGDAVNVTNNETLSQLKILLYRTQGGGQLFYLVTEFVNDGSLTNFTHTDNEVDSNLVIDFIEPVKVPGLPPKCRYIDVWRNQLVMTGNRDNVNTVYYSDFDVESFPLDQSFVTEARLGGGNSGIKSLDNTLFIFKPRSVIAVTGDLGTDNFQVDGLGDDGVGCVANASIKEVEGVLWFLGKRGIYTVDRQGYRKMSEKIEPEFDSPYEEKRAVAHYWIEKDLYLLQFPVFDTDAGSNKFINETNSFVLVYDLYRKSWVKWNTVNFTTGVAEYNGEVYIAGNNQDPVTTNATSYLHVFMDTGTEEDYADHTEGILFSYKTHWEAMGEPSIYKKFLRIKVHSLDGTINDFETDKFSIDIATQHDYVQSNESTLSLDFSGGSLGWGLSAWGTFPWGESRLEQLTSKLKSKKAKSLRVVFTNDNLKENVLISGYELQIAAAYDLNIKE